MVVLFPANFDVNRVFFWFSLDLLLFRLLSSSNLFLFLNDQYFVLFLWAFSEYSCWKYVPVLRRFLYSRTIYRLTTCIVHRIVTYARTHTDTHTDTHTHTYLYICYVSGCMKELIFQCICNVYVLLPKRNMINVLWEKELWICGNYSLWRMILWC